MSDDEEIICEGCGDHRATVHLTQFIDGEWVPVHLCEECYSKKEGEPQLTHSKLLAQIVGAIAPDLQKMAKVQCSCCGMTYLEFRQALRFGCPDDYQEFAESLGDLLQRIHGADRHVGKIPTGSAQKKTRQLRLDALQTELQELVSNEDFERAAQVRDTIKQLEQDSAGSDKE